MKKAAALAYAPYQNSAPKVVASGKGTIAEQIIQKAREYDVPLFSNTALVDSLIGIEIDSQIPPELYQGVVEVFIWLEHCEKKAQASHNP
ncbi:EscU/YscU/HrcU family type III secretion system export apparatus switch protein [Helicobacter mustelae]|uniref:Putative flagellar biosynthesis protein flhB2 n=1 Tax=Helicobacter mustelae (strain ATCC 43772 / CCUG 25715 / CIP 103759 / LMG 18044 / NCTC 12198 / R85-136P) TaxID=679897 RepID=D3UIT9_HELM1|nr:EscU/YscU/HrcU family type III secretion system export apparatus switch protein [Helicobacter mustelae]CBG40414.1 putative flagellar biosynthesis protein flhB2 [Helicobacter mustelae 12198]SQH71914.1 flagellar biosynthesis protein FlhB [Helicobacter mustelae]STP13054.1 flagellar biosynthesis protein FlhB [Helicobacter mustelae]